MITCTFARLVAALLTGLLATATLAQEWPSRPVRLVVPVPPGGALDPFARTLAGRLADQLKQPFVVDNRAGGSGSIGTAAVASSPPDGHTFGFVFDTHGVNPSLIGKMPFDTLKDLAPVMVIGTSPQLIAANPSRPFAKFADVQAAARTQPGRTSIGSPGNGSLGHLMLLALRRDAGLDLNHVPYKGGGPLVQDLIGGQIDLGISGVPNLLPHVRSRRIVPLAVTSLRRSPSLPDVPTLQELGIAGAEAYTWWGLVAPAGTPPAIVERFGDTVRAILATPEMVKLLNETLAMDTVASRPDEMQRFLAGEIARWQKVVRENDVKPD